MLFVVVAGGFFCGFFFWSGLCFLVHLLFCLVAFFCFFF